MKYYQAHETHRMEELNGVELASFLARAGALFIDMVVCSILFIFLAEPIQHFLFIIGLVHEEKDLMLAFFANWYSIVWFVVYFSLSYFLGNGKTIGKWLCKIRVVSLVHKRLNLWHSIERSLGYGASLLEAGFGFVQYFIDSNCRTTHDKIAETIVVRERKEK